MTAHLVSVGVKCAAAILFALVVYQLLQRSLRDLLDSVVHLPEATTFYLRAFALVLLFGATSAAITDVNVKPDARLAEYFLEISSEMSGVFQDLLLTLLAYVALTTLIVIVLRPKNGK